MNTHRKTAIIVGILFLIAMAASLGGGVGFVEPILSDPDYLVAVSENQSRLMTGVFLELLNGIAVVGIGVLMFPILKKHNESIALGYLGFRIIESVFCCAIVISPLSLMKLGQEYSTAEAANTAYFEAAGALSIAERASIAGLLIPAFMGLGALLFYYLLYQSTLIPRFISAWGFIGAALMLMVNLLEVDFTVGMILVLPLILNEIFLGMWLIGKGFRTYPKIHWGAW